MFFSRAAVGAPMGYGGWLALRQDAVRRWDAEEDSVFKTAGWTRMSECLSALLTRLQLPEHDDDERRVPVYQCEDGGYIAWTNRDLCEGAMSMRAMLEVPNPMFADIEGLNTFLTPNYTVPPEGDNARHRAARLMHQYSRPHLRYPLLGEQNGNGLLWTFRINRAFVFLKILYRHPKLVRPKILAFVRRVARIRILLGRVWKEAREESYKPGGAGAKRARQSFESQLP